MDDQELDRRANEALAPATRDGAPLAWDVTRFTIFVEAEEGDADDPGFAPWARRIGAMALKYTGE